MKLIKKSAMVIVKDNRLLVVRKRGSPDFLMPGGKPERDESPIEALKREIMEEISCDVDSSSIALLGTFEDLTSDGRAKVSIDLFSGELIGEPKPSSEIEELGWISAADAISPNITPVIKRQILSFLLQNGMLHY